MDGSHPNFRGVRVALGTSYNPGEANRRASRNGLESDPPPETPSVDLHIFSSRSVDGEQAAYIVVMRDPVRRIAEQYIEWGNQVSPFPPQPAPPPAPPHPGRLDFSGGGFTGRAKRQAPFNAHHFYKRQSSLSTAARFVEWLRTQPDNLMVRARLHHCWDEIVVVPAGALRALRKRLYSVGH